MRENVDQNNSEYEHFLRSVYYRGWKISKTFRMNLISWLGGFKKILKNK